MPDLTEKQKKFCQEYIVDLNATQAAIRAGYSKKSASRIAIELLNKTHVSNYLQGLQKKQEKRTAITADSILTRLNIIADRCMQIEPVLDRSGKKTGVYKFDATGANKSLELLGKHLALFTDKVEHSGKIDNSLTSKLAELPVEELRKIVYGS